MDIENKRLPALSIVAIACILVCFSTAVWPNIGSDSIGTLVFGAVIFTPILSIPFVLLWYFGQQAKSVLFGNLFIVAMLAALAWWCFVFWESFLIPENLDAQSGLVFLFGPLYSSIAALVFGNVLVFLDRRSRN
jgi:hypothetical protein